MKILSTILFSVMFIGFGFYLGWTYRPTLEMDLRMCENYARQCTDDLVHFNRRARQCLEVLELCQASLDNEQPTHD